MPDDINQPLRQIKRKEQPDTRLAGKTGYNRLENEPLPAKAETLIESFPEHWEKEKNAEFLEDKNAEGGTDTGAAAAAGLDPRFRQREKEIEKILEKNLGEIFGSLPPAQQRDFKIAGEETARKIGQLMEKIKLNMGKVIKLIRKWLALLPGVNKYYLGQEAKLKADEILSIYERRPR